MSSKPRSTVTRLDAYRRRAAPPELPEPLDRSLDDVLRKAPIGFLHLDLGLRCVKINPWLAAAYGVALDAASGRALADLVPAVAAVVAEDLGRVVESGSPVRRVLPIERTGERHYFQHHFAPVYRPDGRLCGIDVFVCSVDRPAGARKAQRSHESPAREGTKRIPSKLVRPGHGEPSGLAAGGKAGVSRTKTPAA